MKSIKEISEIKKAEYESKYKKWCEETGKIMNGLSSKMIACDYSIHCDTIQELSVLIKVFKGKFKIAQENNSISGFKFIIDAFEEIEEEYLKQLIHEAESTKIL